MSNVISGNVDNCVRIRLSNGATNNLTTEVLREVALALDEAEHSARGIMLCGGDKFFFPMVLISIGHWRNPRLACVPCFSNWVDVF